MFNSVCGYGGVHSYGGKMYCIVPQALSWINAKVCCVSF